MNTNQPFENHESNPQVTTQPASPRSRGPKCSVCSHPLASEIEAAVCANLLSTRKLADQFAIHPSSIHRHKTNCLPLRIMAARPPQVQAAREVVAADLPAITKRMLELKSERLRVLQDRADRLQQLVDERAAAGGRVPGDKTGLLAVTQKAIRVGKEEFRIIEEGTLDAGLLTQERAILRQVTEETGERLIQTGRERGAYDAETMRPLVIVVPALQQEAGDADGPAAARHRIDHSKYKRGGKKVEALESGESSQASLTDVELETSE